MRKLDGLPEAVQALTSQISQLSVRMGLSFLPVTIESSRPLVLFPAKTVVTELATRAGAYVQQTSGYKAFIPKP